MEPVTDPLLLDQLNTPTGEQDAPVADESILSQLNSPVEDPAVLAELNGQNEEDKIFKEDETPSAPHEKLAKKLQDWNLYGSATSALNNAWDKDIRFEEDGSVNAPVMSKNYGEGILANVATGVAGLLTSATRALGSRTSTDEVQSAFKQFAEENGYSQEQVKTAWNDLGSLHREWEEGEETRALSDGMLVPNPQSSTFLDRDKALEAIEKSDASPAWKMAYRANVDKMAEGIADMKTDQYEAAANAIETGGGLFAIHMNAAGLDMPSPSAWALENDRLGDMGTPEFVLDYEKDVIDSAGDLKERIWGYRAAATKGLIKLTNTFAGLGGALGIEAAGEYGAMLSNETADITGGAPDAGFVGALIEEAPSLVAQIAVTRGIGAGVNAGVGAAANAAAKLGVNVSQNAVVKAASVGSNVASTIVAGSQSTGLTYSSEIAAGATHEEAQATSMKAGINTALIVGIFNHSGLGGVESAALGKDLSKITLGDLLRKTGEKTLTTKVREFAGHSIKAALGEATEEGIDELTQAFITADPDTSLADAWTNAEHAASIGGFIGGAVHIGANEIQGNKPPGAPDTPAQEAPPVESVTTPSALAGAGLNATAAQLASTAPNPAPLEEAPEITPEASTAAPVGATTAKVGGLDIPVAEPSGRGVAAALLGDPDRGMEYFEEITPEQFGMIPVPGSPNLHAITFDQFGDGKGFVTDRQFNSETGEVQSDPAIASVMARRNKTKVPYKPQVTRKVVAQPTLASEPADPVVVNKTPSGEQQASLSSTGEQQAPEKSETPTELLPQAQASPEGVTSNGEGEVAPEVESTQASTSAKSIETALTGDGSAITSELERMESDGMYEFPSDLEDGADVGKAIMASALNGDPNAIAAIESMSSPEAIAAKEEMLSALSKSEDPAIKSLSLSTANAPVKPARGTSSGALEMPTAEIKKAITVEKGVEYVDSIPDMQVGDVLSEKDASGSIKSQRVVTFTEKNPDGTVRHTVKKLSGAARSSRVTAPKGAPRKFVNSVKSVMRQASINGVNPSSLKNMETVARAAIASLSSPSFARNNVVVTDEGSDPMYWHQTTNGSHIYINPRVLLEMSGSRANSIPGDNPTALSFAAADFASELRQTAFEELAHHSVNEAIPFDQMINYTRGIVASAARSEATAQVVGKSARWWLSSGGAFGGGRLSGISNEQAVDLLRGKEITHDGETWKLEKSQIDDALFVVGHEAVADLIHLMKTGSNVEDVRAAAGRWARTMSGNDGVAAPKGKAATIMARVIEMANRAAEAIARFFRAHESLDQLPRQLRGMVEKASILMDEKGFASPDESDVVGRSLSRAASEFSRLRPEFNRAVIDSQKALRQIYNEVNDGLEETMPIASVDPQTGQIVVNKNLSEDDQKRIQPLLRTLNSGDRPDIVIETSRIASRMRKVLSHLNPAGDVTYDTFSVNANPRVLPMLARSIRSRIEDAAGMEVDELIRSINAASEGLVEPITAPPIPLDSSVMKVRSVRMASERVDAARIANSDNPSPEAQQAVNDAQDAFDAELVKISEEESELGESVRAWRREQAEAADRISRQLIARSKERLQIGSMGQLLSEASLNPGAVQRAIASPRVWNEVRKASEAMEALRSLDNMEQELDHFVLGSKRPHYYKARTRSGWRNVNANPDAALSIGARNWSFLRGEKPGQDATNINFIGEGIGRTIEFSDQPKDEDPSIRADNAARMISDAAKAAFRTLGFEAGASEDADGRKLSSEEKTERLRANAWEITKPLIDNTFEAWKRADPSVTPNLLATGGFPVDFRTEEGIDKPIAIIKENLIDIPDYNELEGEDSSSRMEEMFANGDVGLLLQSIDGFLRRFESTDPDGTTQSLDRTTLGTTPGGFAYSLIAPLYAEFVALTKGEFERGNRRFGFEKTVSDQLLAENEGATLPHSYVPNGVAMSPTFAQDRVAIAANSGALITKFWDLHRIAKVANATYKSTLTEMRQRNLDKREKFDEWTGARLPVSVRTLIDLAFQIKEKKRVRKSYLKNATERKGSLVSLIRTVPATRFLKDMLSIQAELGDMLFRGFHAKAITAGIENKTDADFDYQNSAPDPKGSFSDEVRGEQGDSRVRSEINEQSELEKGRKTLRHAEAKRAEVLMAMHGGDIDTVLQVVNRPEFSTHREDGTVEYHPSLLDNWIIEQLERMSAEEIGSGAVTDNVKAVYDDSLKVLSEAHPEHKSTIDSFLATGGTASKWTGSQDVSDFDPERKFESSPESVLFGLMDKVPGLTLIEGQKDYRGIKDGEVPTVSFIPGAQSPILALPYGIGSMTAQDAQKAVENTLLWLSEHGGYDLNSAATRIVAQIGELDPSKLKSGASQLIRNDLGARLKGKMEGLHDVESRVLEAEVTAWARYITIATENVVSKFRGSHLFRPVRAASIRPNLSQGFDPATAANVVASALIDRDARKLLMMSMHTNQGFDDPSPEEMAVFGSLASSDMVPGFANRVANDIAINLTDGVSLEDPAGFEGRDEDGFEEQAIFEAEERLESVHSFGKTPMDVTAFGPMVDKQAEWTNNFLHQLVREIGFSGESVPGLVSTKPASTGLTEMEARQAMAVLSDSYLRDSIGTTNTGEVGLGPLVNAGIEAANKVREGVKRIENSDPVFPRSEDFLNYYGTFSFNDPTRYDGVNRDVYREGRIRKGGLLTLQQAGYDFKSSDEEDFEQVEIEADFDDLSRRLDESGFSRSRDSKTFQEIAREEWQAEKDRIDAALAEVTKAAGDQEARLRNARDAFDEVRAMEAELAGADRETFLRTMEQGGIINSSDPGLEGITGAVAGFFAGKDAFAGTMAADIVARYDENRHTNTSVLSPILEEGFESSPQFTELNDLRMERSMEMKRLRSSLKEDLEEASELEGMLDEPELTPQVISGTQWIDRSEESRRRDLRFDLSHLNRRIREKTSQLRSIIQGEYGNTHSTGVIGEANEIMDGILLPFGRYLSEVKSDSAAKTTPSDIVSASGLVIRELDMIKPGGKMKGLVKRMAIRHALSDSERMSPGNGVRSLDLSLLSQDVRVRITEEGRSRINEVLASKMDVEQKEHEVAAILRSDLFDSGMEPAISVVKSILQQEAEKAQSQITQAASQASMVQRASRGVEELTKLTSIQARKVVLRVIKDVQAGNVAAEEQALAEAIRKKAKAQRKVDIRKEAVAAQTSVGFRVAHLSGNPDQIELVQRTLRKYGEVWDQVYMGRAGSFNRFDGKIDSDSNSLNTDMDMAMKADLLSDRENQFTVVDENILAPRTAYNSAANTLKGLTNTKPSEGSVFLKMAHLKWQEQGFASEGETDESWEQAKKDRAGALATRIVELGKSEGNESEIARLQAEVDFISGMASLTKSGNVFIDDLLPLEVRQSRRLATAGPVPRIGTQRTDKIVARITREAFPAGVNGDEFGVISQVRAQVENVERLFSAGFLKGVGRVEVELGVFTSDLESRAKSVLGRLEGGDMDSLKELSDIFNESVAREQGEKTVDAIGGGFVHNELFSVRWLKALMPQDAKLRRLFARKVEGLKAARWVFATLKRGFSEGGGTDGHKLRTVPLADRFNAQMDKLTKGKEFVQASDGYMYAAVVSNIDAARTPSEGAEEILRAFDQADNNLMHALQTRARDYSATGAKAILESTKDKLSEIKAWATEETFKLLEEREVWRSIREKFEPHVRALAEGDTDIGQLKKNLASSIDLESVGYGRFVTSLFAEQRPALELSMRMEGLKVKAQKDSKGHPITVVPFRWQSFNHDLTEDRDIPDTGDLLSVKRSLSLKRPNRMMQGNGIDLLQVNGMEAPLMILSDTIHRISAAPAYRLVKAYTGVTIERSQGTESTRVLEAIEGQEGALHHIAQSLTDKTKVHSIQSASRALALMVQEIILNSLTNASPRSRIMQGVHEASLLGSMKALISASQLWRQTVWGTMSQVILRDGFMKNIDLLPIIAENFGSRIGLGKKEGKTTHEKIKEFVHRNAVSILVRGPNGDSIYLDRLGRTKIDAAHLPEGRVMGKARRITDIATAPFSATHNAGMRLGRFLLQKSISSPEKYIAEPIVVHTALREVNRQQAEMGLEPYTLDQLLDGEANHLITAAMQHDMATAVNDIFGVSSNEEKGRLFQAQKSVWMEAARQVLTTFANHQVSTSSNSTAGWMQMRHGEDKETRAEGRRLVASSMAQNVAFTLFRYETMALALVTAIGAAMGWDDEEKEAALGAFHGVKPGENEDQRRTNVMHWIALLVGGSTQPTGYSQMSGSFVSNERDNDLRRVMLATIKETLLQSPIGGLGVAASTAVGSGISQRLLDGTVGALFPGHTPEYERAGITIGDGSDGDAMERLIYNFSKFFLNDIAPLSTFTGGIESFVDPFAKLSNTEENLDVFNSLLIFGSEAPFLPREARREMERPAKEALSIKEWAKSQELRD